MDNVYSLWKAKNSENLDIHLQTCEIYECKACEHVTKQIAGMKTHMKESNEECGDATIFHIKIDRNDKKVANCKEYKQSDIFKEKLTTIRIKDNLTYLMIFTEICKKFTHIKKFTTMKKFTYMKNYLHHENLREIKKFTSYLDWTGLIGPEGRQATLPIQ